MSNRYFPAYFRSDHKKIFLYKNSLVFFPFCLLDKMTILKPINICFFRNVLRVHDNQSLHHALTSHQHVLPVVCLDPRMIDISLLNEKLGMKNETPKTWSFKLERCANFRTSFIIECIMSLKQELVKRKSDLLILFGKPEDLFPALKQYLLKNHYKLDKIHTHKEVS